MGREELLELKEAFDLFDTDKSGAIETAELKAAMSSLGYEHTNKLIFQILENLDKNQDGQIDFDEFLDMMSAKLSDKDSREDIMKVFNLFDQDGTGRITIEDLRHVARELGEEISEEELKEMVDRADSGKTGSVSPDDFYNIMTKKSFT